MIPFSATFFPLTLGLLAFIWTLRKHRDLIKSGMMALCFWMLGFVLDIPIAKYLLNTPARDAKQRQEQAEKILLSRAEYQAFKQFDPQGYSAILARVTFVPESKTVVIGSPEWDLSARYTVRTQLGMDKSLQRVSDKAIAEYVDVMLEELGIIQEQGEGLCYGYLYGWPEGTINASKYFSPTLLDAESKAVASVVYSSKVAAQLPPDGNKASAIFWSVMPKLTDEFGEDAQMIADPYRKGADKAKLCRITTRFLKLARQLPDSDSSMVLRSWVTPHG